MRAPASLVLAALAALGASTLAGRAAADLPPPHGYVDTCSVETQAKHGTECLGCRAYHGNMDYCDASLGPYGFTQACRGLGASSWGEVWCRPATPDAAKVPPEVLAQLDDPVNGRRSRPPPAPTAAPTTAPATTATPAAVPPPALPASPLPSSSAAPAGTTTRPDAGAPGPEPVPLPPGGCGCTTAGAGAGLPALVLAVGAAAAGLARRRRSRR